MVVKKRWLCTFHYLLQPSWLNFSNKISSFFDQSKVLLKYFFTRSRLESIITFNFIFLYRLIHLERGNHSWLRCRMVNLLLYGGLSIYPRSTANSVKVMREKLGLVRMIPNPLGYYLYLVGFLLFHSK